MSIARDLLIDHGYEGLTMRELAERSGVALKTLYDIYGSKDNLLVAAVRARVTGIYDRAEASRGDMSGVPRLLYYVDAGSEAIRATATFSKSVAPLLAGPVDHFGTYELYNRFHGRALDDIRAAGELRRWAEPRLLVESLIAALTGVLLIWAKDQISSDEMVAFNRVTAAQIVLPAVTGEAANAALAAIEDYYRRTGSGSPAVAEVFRPAPLLDGSTGPARRSLHRRKL